MCCCLAVILCDCCLAVASACVFGILGLADAPPIARGSAPEELQPCQGINIWLTPDAPDAIDEPGALALVNGGAHMMRTDPGDFELATRGQQSTITLPAMLHVLDHQKVQKPPRVDAELAPGFALEQITWQLDECFARGRHREPRSFKTSSQSEPARGGT
jgi:hypothetical protein